MYWNNPIETVRYPSDSNIIFKSQHNDRHCLFYDPEVDKHNIANNQTLQDLCDWANTLIKNHGVTQFLNDKNNR